MLAADPKMEELRKLFEAGDESALYVAANSCWHPTASEAVLPMWVLEALVERQVEALRQLPGKGRGRSAGRATQHRMDLVHLARYAEFARCRQEGLNETKAADQAATALKDTPFHNGAVTAGAILKSVDLIEKAREKDPEAFRRRFTFRSPGWMLSKK